MILTRDKFIEHWDNLKPGMGGPTSPLWHPEKNEEQQFNWFVNVRPIRVFDHHDGDKFYQWCLENCQGIVRCFSSNYTEEWWGFTDQNDIAWWLLKWSK